MKRPDFILTQAHTWIVSVQETRTLPKGSFVRPISYEYLPAHIREQYFRTYRARLDVFVYTHFGIIPVPKDIVLEVTS